MRRVLPLKILLASVLIAACVTINVYFPAAAADKAATDYWNDVTGGANKGSAPQPQSQTPPQSNFVPDAEPDVLVAAVANVLYALVPAGFALLGLQALAELVKRIAFLRGIGPNPLLQGGHDDHDEHHAADHAAAGGVQK